VCEDVAARALALPFFADISENEVLQVARALREALDRPSANS
jgi:dTDP-4-amino-4,6-dideoxygalactose transaminase